MSEPYDLPGLEAGNGTRTGTGPGPLSEATRAPMAGAETGGAAPEAPRPPGPLGVAVGMTGNAEVDAVVVRLGDADELPTEAHIEVYEDVHQGLREALASLDENRG
ncbi:hypothetical protein [Streptomyces sp.]|uniref:hypothetical protein n=1 Tax=Streptomyces sp. TaxID=1931 RepID=UPI002F3F6CD9